MSSRNAYLDPAQRKSALVLHHSLLRLQQVFDQGERSVARLAAIGKEMFGEEPSVRLDYFEIVNPETLEPVMQIDQPALAAVAAFVDTTRLIDNVVLGK